MKNLRWLICARCALSWRYVYTSHYSNLFELYHLYRLAHFSELQLHSLWVVLKANLKLASESIISSRYTFNFANKTDECTANFILVFSCSIDEILISHLDISFLVSTQPLCHLTICILKLRNRRFINFVICSIFRIHRHKEWYIEPLAEGVE